MTVDQYFDQKNDKSQSQDKSTVVLYLRKAGDQATNEENDNPLERKDEVDVVEKENDKTENLVLARFPGLHQLYKNKKAQQKGEEDTTRSCCTLTVY